MLRKNPTSKSPHSPNKSITSNNNNNNRTKRGKSRASNIKSISPIAKVNNNNNNNNNNRRNSTPLSSLNEFQQNQTTPNTPLQQPPQPTINRRLLLSRLRLREHQEMVFPKEVELYHTFKGNSFYTLHILERFRSKQIAPAFRLPAIPKHIRYGTPTSSRNNMGGEITMKTLHTDNSKHSRNGTPTSNRNDKGGSDIAMTTVYTNNRIAKRFLEGTMLKRHSSPSIMNSRNNSMSSDVGMATPVVKSRIKTLLDVPSY